MGGEHLLGRIGAAANGYAASRGWTAEGCAAARELVRRWQAWYAGRYVQVPYVMGWELA